jgi:hypothetical protein
MQLPGLLVTCNPWNSPSAFSNADLQSDIVDLGWQNLAKLLWKSSTFFLNILFTYTISPTVFYHVLIIICVTIQLVRIRFTSIKFVNWSKHSENVHKPTEHVSKLCSYFATNVVHPLFKLQTLQFLFKGDTLRFNTNMVNKALSKTTISGHHFLLTWNFRSFKGCFSFRQVKSFCIRQNRIKGTLTHWAAMRPTFFFTCLTPDDFNRQSSAA